MIADGRDVPFVDVVADQVDAVHLGFAPKQDAILNINQMADSVQKVPREALHLEVVDGANGITDILIRTMRKGRRAHRSNRFKNVLDIEERISRHRILGRDQREENS